ncbi:unnamed protein product [Miscanthus lutarioriparius]|uniref:Retrovirus-related Pol polyprotein from transposon TNT 1-94-like beta-barrel domain-containing protein n=1 Tax=Miscanthus lutarioriparius TaxID=422564 RepID=A0A811SMN4_9POAL|nr:unnamed protein product [Miscanthus lutarioriparius]
MSDGKADVDKTFTPTANLTWPVLTRSNYQGWASHIQCNLEGLNLWEAIEKGEKADRRQDRLALGSMLRGVPTEMHSMLLNKKSAKEAWEAIKTMRLGADRVKEVNAQKLLGEFESMAFKPGESIDDFALRITKLVTDLRGLGEESVTDARMVRKFLRVVPKKVLSWRWLLRCFTGARYRATNHMTGAESHSLPWMIQREEHRFGDGSRVEIRNWGGHYRRKNTDHRVLTNVYYIPSLRCNIVDLGQLEEANCRVEIDEA